MKKITQLCCLMISILIVAGCSTGMNSDFSCPLRSGSGCQSLDQINDAVNSGQINNNGAGMALAISNQPNDYWDDQPAYVASPQAQPIVTPTQTTNTFTAIKPGDPIRVPETVQRIWIGPFVDADGDYHQPFIKYSVVKPGQWIGSPPQAIENANEDQ